MDMNMGDSTANNVAARPDGDGDINMDMDIRKDDQYHTIKQEIADNDNDVDATPNPNDDNFEATDVNEKRQ